jgi:hypothetical protein
MQFSIHYFHYRFGWNNALMRPLPGLLVNGKTHNYNSQAVEECKLS